jgi:hypothetical protein
MSPAGFETTIPANDRTQTHVLKSSATGSAFESILLRQMFRVQFQGYKMRTVKKILRKE